MPQTTRARKRPSGTSVRHVEIGLAEAGQRLDNYLLRRLKGVPRARIYRMLRKGEVRINSGRVRPSYRLVSGDRLRLPPVRTAAETAPPRPESVAWLSGRILYEDSQLIVLDKPSGMAVHGGSGRSFGLIEALRALRPEEAQLELVHRLDRDSSGCLLIAKHRAMLRELHRLMREGAVEKRYLALAAGCWQLGRKLISAPLETDRRRGGERIVAVGPRGKAAVSEFRPIELFRDASLLEVRIATGRTHQIRVHAAHAGHPLAGDEKYGERDFNAAMRVLGLNRLFLHAASIGFTRPDSGEEASYSAPLSEDLRSVLERLPRRR